MNIDRISDAYKRGSENYYADFELKDNPYNKETKQFTEWNSGYLDALNAQDLP